MLFQAFYKNLIQIVATYQQHCSAKLTNIKIIAPDQYLIFVVVPDEEAFVILVLKF